MISEVQVKTRHYKLWAVWSWTILKQFTLIIIIIKILNTCIGTDRPEHSIAKTKSDCPFQSKKSIQFYIIVKLCNQVMKKGSFFYGKFASKFPYDLKKWSKSPKLYLYLSIYIHARLVKNQPLVQYILKESLIFKTFCYQPGHVVQLVAGLTQEPEVPG